LTTKTIKYTILILLGLLIFYQFIPIGDYCSGMANSLLFLALGALFLLAFLIILIFDIIKRVKQKQSFDFIPLVVFIIIVGSNYSLLKTDNKKFWTTEVLVAGLERNGYGRTNRMILYKNNSFAITCYDVEIKCTIQGNYTSKGDTLKLNRKGLAKLTNNAFTAYYIISKRDSTLIPLDTTFKIIKVNTFSKGF
jgi:hypothetical protein